MFKSVGSGGCLEISFMILGKSTGFSNSQSLYLQNDGNNIPCFMRLF